MYQQKSKSTAKRYSGSAWAGWRSWRGRCGFWSVVHKHFGGNARAMVNTLIARGLAAQDACPANSVFQWDGRSAVPNRLPADWDPIRLSEGEGTATMDIPVVLPCTDGVCDIEF